MRFLSSLSTRHYRRLALLWTAGIVAACSLPAASLSPIEPALSADKAIHFGLFAVFGALWMRALRPPSGDASEPIRRRSLRILGWGSLFAVGTEVYQHILPLERLGDPYDALADGAGLLFSVVTYAVLARWGAKPDQSSRAN